MPSVQASFVLFLIFDAINFMFWGISGANLRSVYEWEKIFRLRVGFARVLAKLLGKRWRCKTETGSSMHQLHLSYRWA